MDCVYYNAICCSHLEKCKLENKRDSLTSTELCEKTFLENYRNAPLENTCDSIDKHNYHSFPLSHKPQGVHFILTYTFLTVCKLPFSTTPDSIVLQIRENVCCFFFTEAHHRLCLFVLQSPAENRTQLLSIV